MALVCFALLVSSSIKTIIMASKLRSWREETGICSLGQIFFKKEIYHFTYLINQTATVAQRAPRVTVAGQSITKIPLNLNFFLYFYIFTPSYHLIAYF